MRVCTAQSTDCGLPNEESRMAAAKGAPVGGSALFEHHRLLGALPPPMRRPRRRQRSGAACPGAPPLEKIYFMSRDRYQIFFCAGPLSGAYPFAGFGVFLCPLSGAYPSAGFAVFLLPPLRGLPLCGVSAVPRNLNAQVIMRCDSHGTRQACKDGGIELSKPSNGGSL